MAVKDKPSILKVKQVQSACPVVATGNTLKVCPCSTHPTIFILYTTKEKYFYSSTKTRTTNTYYVETNIGSKES